MRFFALVIPFSESCEQLNDWPSFIVVLVPQILTSNICPAQHRPLPLSYHPDITFIRAEKRPGDIHPVFEILAGTSLFHALGTSSLWEDGPDCQSF